MALDSFQTNFYKDYAEIVRSIDGLAAKIDSLSNEADKKAAFANQHEQITRRIDALQSYFGEHSSSLPTFEVRKSQEHLTKLSRLVQEKRDLFAPKKKFGFKSKQNLTSLENKIETESVTSAATAAVAAAKSAESLTGFNVESSCCLRSLRDQTVVKLEDEINGKDVAIIDVKNVTIVLQGSPSVLHVDSVYSCTILCGPVVGSAFVNQCRESKLVVACHQLRIHETSNTQLYIHVGSRAIIENTRGVSFAPYAWTFPSLEAHFASALSLKPAPSGFLFNFAAVDDFNWLNQSQKSPNWDFLEDSQRENWKTDDSGKILNL